MNLHYNKHHTGYVEKLNKLIAESATSPQKKVELAQAIKFNGGGHFNHEFFWESLAPKGKGGKPSETLLKMIKDQFGSLDKLQKSFSEWSTGTQGSGWGWLAYNKNSGKLEYR